jgi:pantoate--beta-alanine ligase
MQIFQDKQSLIQALQEIKAAGKSIGFVPTMGALHDGHISLVRSALQVTDQVVVSIFVNPTQFNTASDLDKYPRTLEADIALLQKEGDIFVFAPEVSEIYPEDDFFGPFDLEGIDLVMEGKFRPGHFQGVVHVVRNLFQIVQPQKAFFGLKDFQQVAVIRLMTKKLALPIEIVACAIERSTNGLALSSRNLRLSETQKEDALILFQTLALLKKLKKEFSPAVSREKAMEFFKKGKLELEYLELVSSETLEALDQTWSENSTCCIAAFCGEVRLIDTAQL